MLRIRKNTAAAAAATMAYMKKTDTSVNTFEMFFRKK